ncbi:MAG TPA: DinB family protein [Bryobacteraceae bacterium]|nr:DinB family protein [Bryobacteraceae bacterium]
MSELQCLLTLLDEAFERKAWHGPNLRAALRGVSASQAAWRPEPGRHNIWELVVHAAYWKYVVRRRITGGKRASFPLAGSNWFACPAAPDETSWKKTKALLASEHAQLKEVAAGLRAPDAATLRLVRGAASHDLYHAGQIQLLKRLCPERSHAE